MIDVFIQQLEMPITIRGFCQPEPDGSYTVVINSLLSDDAKTRTICHEFRHILANDFQTGGDAYEEAV